MYNLAKLLPVFLLPSGIWGHQAQDEEDYILREEIRLSDARRLLERSPDDPKANTAVGEFLCLLKNDWETGAPLVAKGQESALRQAILADSVDPLDGNALAARAEAWVALAAKSKGIHARSMRLRAAQFYKRSLRTALDEKNRKKTLSKLGVLLTAIGTLTIRLKSDVAWMDTGLDVVREETVRISAEGKWCLDQNPGGMVDFKGYAKVFDKGAPLPTAQFMCLLAKIGQSGKPWAPYKDPSLIAPGDGRLFLGCNDFGVADNIGELKVYVSFLLR